MGAGQIGGIASILDVDFDNAAGFVGRNAEVTEAQYAIYYLSHAMLFCAGALLEGHVILTPASCIFGEKYKFPVFGGTHDFLENAGVARMIDHIGIHKAFNITMGWEDCTLDNVALMVIGQSYHFNHRVDGSSFLLNRLRYTLLGKDQPPDINSNCRYYGWGSRRNGYLLPLLIRLRRVDVQILSADNCQQMWNYGEKFLCLQQFPCKDDLGSVIECGGFLRGMMTSRIIDRPCGIGFLDMTKYTKFITCGVDDSRDILTHDDFMEFEFIQTTMRPLSTPKVQIVTMPAPKDSEENTVSPDPDAVVPPKRIG